MTRGQKGLIGALQAHIQRHEAELVEMRSALATVERIFGGLDRAATVGRPRRQPLAAGSLGDRILELAAQPVPLATLVDGGTIDVRVERAGRAVFVVIANPRDLDGTRRGTGFGLDIVRRRLAASFGSAAALAVEAAADSYRVTVTLPIEEAGA